MVTKPTINLNGTSSRELLEQHLLPRQWATFGHPNGRDYQLSPDTFRRAQIDHVHQLARIGSAMDELKQLAEFISDHC